MTTQEKLEQMVYDCGMPESQASAIVEKAKDKIKAISDQYDVTYHRPADEYPEPLYNVIFNIAIKPAALEFIEENYPQHWAKAMFQ